jgi:hypothetical protein
MMIYGKNSRSVQERRKGAEVKVLYSGFMVWYVSD